MCKEFHEVDDLAAKLLLNILDDPVRAPDPKTNPFTPIEDRGESINQYNPYGMGSGAPFFKPMESWLKLINEYQDNFDSS